MLAGRLVQGKGLKTEVDAECDHFGLFIGGERVNCNSSSKPAPKPSFSSNPGDGVRFLFDRLDDVLNGIYLGCFEIGLAAL